MMAPEPPSPADLLGEQLAALEALQRSLASRVADAQSETLGAVGWRWFGWQGTPPLLLCLPPCDAEAYQDVHVAYMCSHIFTCLPLQST